MIYTVHFPYHTRTSCNNNKKKAGILKKNVLLYLHYYFKSLVVLAVVDIAVVASGLALELVP